MDFWIIIKMGNIFKRKLFLCQEYTRAISKNNLKSKPERLQTFEKQLPLW
jgi:hypothetical protein